MSYIVVYPAEPQIYSIELVEVWGLYGRSYYPVIRKNSVWIHEFGCSWDDKNEAMKVGEKYVKDLVDAHSKTS